MIGFRKSPASNAPGDYLKDYAQHPGDYALKVIDSAGKGTYKHYFPLVQPGATAGSPVKR